MTFFYQWGTAGRLLSYVADATTWWCNTLPM